MLGRLAVTGDDPCCPGEVANVLYSPLTKGPESLLALETLVAHAELCLGEGEGVPQVERPVHVRVGKRDKVLGLVVFLGSLQRGILLEALLLLPALLRLRRNIDEQVAPRVRFWSSSLGVSHLFAAPGASQREE